MSSFWERRPGETSRAYAAFTVYRDMGIARSLKKAAEIFYQGATKAKVGQFETWSRQNLWVPRAEAYDLHLERQERLELEEYRRNMNRRHRNLASSIQGKLVTFLNSVTEEQVQTLSWTQIAPLLSAATQLERLATGESTERIEEPDRRPQ